MGLTLTPKSILYGCVCSERRGTPAWSTGECLKTIKLKSSIRVINIIWLLNRQAWGRFNASGEDRLAMFSFHKGRVNFGTIDILFSLNTEYVPSKFWPVPNPLNMVRPLKGVGLFLPGILLWNLPTPKNLRGRDKKYSQCKTSENILLKYIQL